MISDLSVAQGTLDEFIKADQSAGTLARVDVSKVLLLAQKIREGEWGRLRETRLIDCARLPLRESGSN